MREITKDNLLRSWKEIAAYLGVDVRTCHRWEDQRGMPVHRAEGSEKKSPVFAYKDELDAWFRATFRSSDTTKIAAVAGKRRPWLKWAVAGAAVIALAAAFFREGGPLAKTQPADFTIEGSSLVVTDRHGRELWRFDTGLDDLLPESFFRTRFQVLSHDVAESFPSLVVKDLDGDGSNEVLFAPKSASEPTGLGRLRCFDRKGAERWAFDAGRELRCPDKTFSPDYRITGFVCHDLDGDGRLETLVFAYHRPDWPCQMAVLDCRGKLVGEYWNAGYLSCLAFKDLDGDGREELVVVGVNNEHRGGCLAVFDTRRIEGGSPQSGRFACEGIGPGSELYYVRVPYADVSEAMGDVVAGFNYVFVTGNDRISATYGPSLFYEFDFSLAGLQVSWGHGYEWAHAEMSRAGRLSSVLGPEYARRLLEAIRWWDGAAWVDRPARVRR